MYVLIHCTLYVAMVEVHIFIGTQVTALLRKISLLAKPIFLGHYMQEVIIPK